MPRVRDWNEDDEDEMLDESPKASAQYRPVSHRQATQRRAEDGKNRIRRNKEWY